MRRSGPSYPLQNAGDKVGGGDIIGTVQETDVVQQKIMIPVGVSGTLYLYQRRRIYGYRYSGCCDRREGTGASCFTDAEVACT